MTPFIVLIALLSIALVGYAQYVAGRVVDRQALSTPLADGVQEQVAATNLALVRAIAGDAQIDVQKQVFAPLRSTQAVVHHALAAGGGIALVKSGDAVANDLRRLAGLLDDFIANATDRWQHRDGTGRIGGDADKEAAKLYGQIRAASASLRSDVDMQTEHDQDMLQTLNVAVLVVLMGLFAFVLVFSRRSRRAIVRKNAELEFGVRERTAELATSEARVTAIVNSSLDAIITIDERGEIQSVNPATEKIFGYPTDSLVGKNVSVLMDEEHRRQHAQWIRRYLETGDAHIIGKGRELVARRKDGTMFPIDISISEAKIEGHKERLFVGVVRDITERKRAEEDLRKAKALAEEAATRDSLTNLWNHNRVIEILIEELARSERQSTPVSVAMVDLDHFKEINDTHGHLVGDEVLREVAARLMNAVRAYDSVGRFGGEEFVVILPGTSRATANATAERIRAEIARSPVRSSAGQISLTASLGIVTREGGAGQDATALLAAADTALYAAKEAGRDRVEIAVA